MGQHPNRARMNIPIPTKIGSKMGGEFTYQPKWDPKTDPWPFHTNGRIASKPHPEIHTIPAYQREETLP